MDATPNRELPNDTCESKRIASIYETHAAELRRFATVRVRDAVAAEDVVQEAFLRLAIEAREGRFPRQPRAWLYRVVLNLIVSAARRAKTSGAVPMPESYELPDFVTPESHVLARERAVALSVAMEAAGPRARTGIAMAAQGYSGREIAGHLGRSEVAARALMCRARTGIRRALILAEAI